MGAAEGDVRVIHVVGFDGFEIHARGNRFAPRSTADESACRPAVRGKIKRETHGVNSGLRGGEAPTVDVPPSPLPGAPSFSLMRKVLVRRSFRWPG